MQLDAKTPEGPLETKWDTHRFQLKLVNPSNRRKFTIIVVGTGLAGASAAAWPTVACCVALSPRRRSAGSKA